MKLNISGLEFDYSSTPILHDVHMQLAPSEVLGIVGPNGAGKSTLLKCINRILKPTKGCILLDGQDMNEMNQMELARSIGYVPQASSTIFPATVLDTVLMGRRPHINWRSSERDVQKVLGILKLMNIEDFALRDVNELSGGQQQRVVIARALAQEPKIILLDEPTSNLDVRHQLEVMETLSGLVDRQGISAIMAVHDLNLASRFSDRLLIMKKGTIINAGTPLEVLTPENICSVYGVESEIVYTKRGVPLIVPIKSIVTGSKV
jgi:iron complex transport system ATP-binding protein